MSSGWEATVYRHPSTGGYSMNVYRVLGTQIEYLGTVGDGGVVVHRTDNELQIIQPFLSIDGPQARSILTAIAAAIRADGVVPDRERELENELRATQGAKASCERTLDRTLDIIEKRILQ